jgi:hypothetical protein
MKTFARDAEYAKQELRKEGTPRRRAYRVVPVADPRLYVCQGSKTHDLLATLPRCACLSACLCYSMALG